MLIKLQKTRFSPDYFIIENARNVSYRDKPIRYFAEDALVWEMTKFVNSEATVTAPKHTCWYQIEEGSDLPYQVDFEHGYAVNELSFTTTQGEPEVIRFDGEAFICNDEGKTVHRIRVGGCPSSLEISRRRNSASADTQARFSSGDGRALLASLPEPSSPPFG